MRSKPEIQIQKKFKSTQKESESKNVDNEALKKFKEENEVMWEHLKEIYKQVWNWNRKLGMNQRDYAHKAMPEIRSSLRRVERRLGIFEDENF